METTDIWYKDAHDALRIETGEENPEIWSLWFGNPFNNKTRISSEISRREREKGGREGGRERTVTNMFLVFSLFCRRNSSLKHT